MVLLGRSEDIQDYSQQTLKNLTIVSLKLGNVFTATLIHFENNDSSYPYSKTGHIHRNFQGLKN